MLRIFIVINYLSQLLQSLGNVLLIRENQCLDEIVHILVRKYIILKEERVLNFSKYLDFHFGDSL